MTGAPKRHLAGAEARRFVEVARARSNAPGSPTDRSSGDRIHLRRILIGIDAVAVITAWMATVARSSPLGASTSAAFAAGVIVMVGIACLHSQGTYRSRLCGVWADELTRCARAAGLLGGCVYLAGPRLGAPLDVESMLLFIVATVLTLASGRAGFRTWAERQRRAGRLNREVVVVGMDEETANLAAHLRRHPELGMRAVGVVGPPGPWLARVEAPWLGDLPDVGAAIRRARATGAVVATSAMASPGVNRLVRTLHSLGVHVHLSTGLQRIDHRRLRSLPLAHEPLLYVEAANVGALDALVKRLLDVVVASAVLIAAAPLLLLAAAAVKLQDGGPVLFRQTRVGKDGAHFEILKLRTMTVDAEEKLSSLRERNLREGPLFKAEGDPRVTRVGRVLRCTSIDELPQLVNVLRGEMSLVGPRPPLPSEVETFDEELKERFSSMPGVTGLWQVEARDDPSFELYRQLDLFYVENWSIGLDLTILALTVPAVVGRAVRSFLPTPRPYVDIVASSE